MRKIATIIVAAAIVGTPAHAAGWTEGAESVRAGAFMGVRLRMRLGGEAASKPEAAFTLAPTLTQRGFNGSSKMRIGEGFALNLAAGAKPSLTLAGVPADAALGLRRQGQVDSENKLGISTGGWVAIGAGVALVVGGLILYNKATDCDHEDDECGF